MANNKKENKIEKFTKEAIGKTLNQFNKEIGMADLVEINKNQDRILNGILSQVNDESTEKTEKSNIITLDNSTDGIVELKEIQGDTNVNVSKIEEDMPITNDIGDKEGNIFSLNEVTQGAINIGEIEGNTLVNCNKDDKKELVLMKDLSTQGDNKIDITEGVDGGLVDVALEGNTLVNVSKTKDSTAISKAHTVENSGNHIALQGDVDGNCRPVVTGNTLVNLWQWDKLTKSENDITIDDRGYISMPTQNSNTSAIYSDLNIKIGSIYTYVVEVSEFSLLDSNGTTQNELLQFIFPYGWANMVSIKSTGYYTGTFTANEIKTTNNFRLLRYGGTTGNFKARVTILEGDYTNKPIPDYFEGLQSSFEDNLVTQEMVDNGEEVADNLGKYKVEYKVTGKNKFDKSKALDGYEIANASENMIIPSVSWFVTDFIPVIPNTSYKISGKNTGDSIIYYDNNKQVLQGGGGGTSLITIPNNVRYIKLNGFLTQKDTFQLEEGDTATSYEPYKESIKTLYLNSPLLEGDTIEEKDGGIYHVHRSKEVVLDGKYNWSQDKQIGNTNIYQRYVNTRKFSDMKRNSNYTNTMKSDKIKIAEHYQVEEAEVLTGYPDSSSFPNVNWIYMLTTKSNDELKTYFTENPVTVVYELATPQYELIEQSNLAIPSYSNGHLDLTSAVPVSKVNFLHFEEELTYLYANTQYTLQFISDAETTADITLGGTQLLAQSIITGLNRISITTPDTLVNNKLIIDGLGVKISEVVVTDTDREFGYFEGMKSVGENGLKIYSGKPQRFGKGGRI